MREGRKKEWAGFESLKVILIGHANAGFAMVNRKYRPRFAQMQSAKPRFVNL